jgi:hypothetical protein
VVVLQNARFDRGTTRFVAPLVLSKRANVAEHCLAPRFNIHGVEVVMDVFNLATLPANRLGFVQIVNRLRRMEEVLICLRPGPGAKSHCFGRR